ncbi:MAG: hypothetical protein ACP5UQ_10690 [Anaerolineae bacterium]
MDEFLRALMGGEGKPHGEEDDATLGNLLARLLGEAGGGQVGGSDTLGGMLATLLGGGSGGGGNDVAGLAEQAQVTPAVVQAVLALLAGRLAGQAARGEAAVDLNALLAQASAGATPDEATLKASGLPQELTKTTGLDLGAAIKALQRLLPLLAGLFNLPGLKPATKPKPQAASSPAAKPKPASSTARPKPASSSTRPSGSTAKPKPSGSTARPRPASSTGKPKPAGSTSKPKPTTKPRPRKSEGLPEIEINPDEPADA